MLEAYKTAVANQFDAVLCSLNNCLKQCPDSNLDMRVGAFKFNHVVFHTLIFTDLYLSEDESAFREQSFHHENRALFNDYDELSPGSTETTPNRETLVAYLEFCRNKSSRVIHGETVTSLEQRTGFPWLDFPRWELHIYNIRHIQHHVAGLGLRLRLDLDCDTGWVKSGWTD